MVELGRIEDLGQLDELAKPSNNFDKIANDLE